MTDLRVTLRNILMETDHPVHVGWLPQRATLPCITLNVVSNQPRIHLSGALPYSVARVQIDCWANRIEQAVTLKWQIFSLLQTLVMPLDELEENPEIHRCVLESESDRSESPRDGSDTWTFRIQSDYLITHSIPLPDSLILNGDS